MCRRSHSALCPSRLRHVGAVTPALRLPPWSPRGSDRFWSTHRVVCWDSPCTPFLSLRLEAVLARRSFHCLLINEKMFNMKIRQLKLYESGETQKQQQSRPCDIKEGSRDWSFPTQATSVSDVSKPQGAVGGNSWLRLGRLKTFPCTEVTL